MKQETIHRQFERGPMYRSGASSIKQAEVNGGDGDAAVRFGRFRLLPRERQLLVDGQPVDLGSRAFDLLMVLVKAPGTLVTKNEILSRVWPGTAVEQNNLQVQVSALRKVLGDRDVIRTIPGRGYIYIVENTTASTAGDALTLSGLEPSPLRIGRAPSANSSAPRLAPRTSEETAPDAEARP